MKKQNGITLISLIITIIIMLILAGVALSMVMGEGSVIDQATAASENTRGAEIYESVELAYGNNKIAKYSGTGSKTKQEVVDQLYADGKITADEKTDIEEDWKITIGNVETDFTKLDDDYVPPVDSGDESDEVVTIEPNATLVYGVNDTAVTLTAVVENADEVGNMTYTYKYKKTSDSSYTTVDTNIANSSTTFNVVAGYSYDFQIIINYDGNTKVLEENSVFVAETCFVAGTKVLTENGYKNIEDIVVGDKVYSLNIDNNQRELKEVLNTMISVTNEVYEIKVGDKVIEATGKHKFYIVDKGWIKASDLEVGDVVVAKDNATLEISSVEVKNYEENISVYNLTVEGTHNYLITELEVLVHNAPSIA